MLYAVLHSVYKLPLVTGKKMDNIFKTWTTVIAQLSELDHNVSVWSPFDKTIGRETGFKPVKRQQHGGYNVIHVTAGELTSNSQTTIKDLIGQRKKRRRILKCPTAMASDTQRKTRAKKSRIRPPLGLRH